jgi:hypothetical protein
LSAKYNVCGQGQEIIVDVPPVYVLTYPKILYSDKNITKYKHSSLIVKSVIDEEKNINGVATKGYWWRGKISWSVWP